MLAWNKPSYLQDLFQNSTMWLRDTGILNKLWNDELNAPVHVPDPKVRINEPLNLYQVGIAFMAVAGGLVLALLGFLLEICCSSKRIKKGDKNQVSRQPAKIMSKLKPLHCTFGRYQYHARRIKSQSLSSRCTQLTIRRRKS